MVACFFWLQEALICHEYVYKYVVRYRRIRSTLNDDEASVDHLSIYDLTNHREGRGKWQSRLAFPTIRFDQAVFYVALALVPLVLFWITT